jgi:hypothetical protein
MFHTLGIKDDPASTDGPTRLADRAKAINDVIVPYVPKGRTVDLLLWPDFKERHVIGCQRVEGEGGTWKPKPRWGVYLGHVARSGDSPDMEDPLASSR